jgi:hypothetical protein
MALVDTAIVPVAGGQRLTNYEQARMALAACAKVDEAAVIKDKAAKLAAYARMRDDDEMSVWVSEIHLRACQRIGELSRELDRSTGGKNPKATLPSGGKSKAKALADAGVSTTSAQRYEELAGGREANAQAAALAATEIFFAKSRDEKTPATMKDLKRAVFQAVDDAVGGPPPARQKRAKPSQPTQLYRDWAQLSHYVGGITQVTNLDFVKLAEQSRSGLLLERDIEAAEIATERLALWLVALKKCAKTHGEGK